MVVELISCVKNSETANAKRFRDLLLESEPGLDHADVRVAIASSLYLPARQLDLVVLFEDRRPKTERFRTPGGTRIDSFVVVVEVKHHPADRVRFSAGSVHVRYGGKWTDATDQNDAQKYAFKSYQEARDAFGIRRDASFIYSLIWLAKVSREEASDVPARCMLANEGWQGLLQAASFDDEANRNRRTDRETGEDYVGTFRADPGKGYHTFDTLLDRLLHEIHPTRLDMAKVRMLNQTRFDAEKTQYIQNIGSKGLLMLRGRGGTGKTFTLIQIALHLARQGKRCLILTFNHGLISDISRSLLFYRADHPDIEHFPEITTRYDFIKRMFGSAFGSEAEKNVRNTISSIEARENARLGDLLESEYDGGNRWDIVLVDEGQDWNDSQRDLLYRYFGPENVIVAHGVDQFVSEDRCKWDDDGIAINSRQTLRHSKRLKGAACSLVSEIATRMGVKDWDLQPDPEVYGGRVSVIVEEQPAAAMKKALDLLAMDMGEGTDIRPVNNLVCLPTVKMGRGFNFAALFEREISDRKWDAWRGFDDIDRRIYPERNDQLRAVYYQSCRGMEGWTTVCMGIDSLYARNFDDPPIAFDLFEAERRVEEGLLFDPDEAVSAYSEYARQHALQWLMMALTRAMDHLVIHIADEASPIGEALKTVDRDLEGAIEWF